MCRTVHKGCLVHRLNAAESAYADGNSHVMPLVHDADRRYVVTSIRKSNFRAGLRALDADLLNWPDFHAQLAEVLKNEHHPKVHRDERRRFLKRLQSHPHRFALFREVAALGVSGLQGTHLPTTDKRWRLYARTLANAQQKHPVITQALARYVLPGGVYKRMMVERQLPVDLKQAA